jgi:hypothetical protein
MKQAPFEVRLQLVARVFEDDVDGRSWLQYGDICQDSAKPTSI